MMASASPPDLISFTEVGPHDMVGWAAAGELYAVVDGCIAPDLPSMAQELGPQRVACLYLGHAATNYGDKAPYLLRVDAAQAEDLATRFGGQPWGVFLLSSAGFDRTRRQLRRFLQVRSPGGEDWLFRFYDPRLLPSFLRSSTAEELNAFFGPVRAFLSIGSDGRGVAACRAPGIVRGTPAVPVGTRPRMSVAHVAAFRRQSVGDRIAARFDGTAQIASREPQTDDLLVRNPDGGVMRLGFGADGQLDRVKSPLGREWHLKSTEAGKPLGMRLPSGLELTMAYDGAGNLASVARNGSERFQAHYDEHRRSTRIDFPDGSWAGTQYRDDGPAALGDPDGRFVAAQRDRIGRVERYAYEGDALAAAVDGNGNITRFDHDRHNRPSALQYADASCETYAFDPAGRVRQLTRRDGHVLDIARDDAGQITCLSAKDGDASTFVYDDAGRLVAARNGDAALAWRYDDAGRLIEERQGDLRVRYCYDDAGTLTGLTYPSGETIRYTRDQDLRLSSITDWSGRKHHIDYAPDDSCWRMTSPDGVSSTVWQTQAGLTAAVRVDAAGQPLFEQAFGYDDEDRLVEQRDSRAGDTRYRYDAEGQLLGVDRSTGAREAFAYDGAGNRVQSPMGAARFDVLNRVLDQGPEHFTYDGRGNLTARDGGLRAWRYAYDGFDRMVRAEDDRGLVVRFGYDPLGRRIWKDVACGGDRRITRYVWAGEQLISETERDLGMAAGSADTRGASRTRDYGYWPQNYTPLFMRVDDAVYRYHNDPLGVPLRLCDPLGRIVWEANRTGFGAMNPAVGSIDQPLRLPGQYHDPETGLHYNRFRYYDPSLGRYLTPDPIGVAGGLNFYAYAGNDPVNRADPSGLWWKTALSIVAAVAVAAVVVATAPISGPLLIVAAGAAAGAAGMMVNEALNQEEFCLSCILLAGVKGGIVGAAATVPFVFVPAAAGVAAYSGAGGASGFLEYSAEVATTPGMEWNWGDAAKAMAVGAATAGTGRVVAGALSRAGRPPAASPNTQPSPVVRHQPDRSGILPERPAAHAAPAQKPTAPAQKPTAPAQASPAPASKPAGPTEPYNRKKHYGRTPTQADRKAVGAGKDQVADHDPPLVKRYYEGDPARGEKPGWQMTPQERAASAGDRSRMSPQPRADSDKQGADMARYSRGQKKKHGL